MKPRVIIIIIAVVLGLFAVVGVNNYVTNIKKQAVEQQKTIEVWVATNNIEKGVSTEDIVNKKLAELKQIPKRYVAADAISSTRNITDKVLSVSVSAGEQLTAAKFKVPSEAGLAYSV